MLSEAVQPGVVVGMAITLCGVLAVSLEEKEGKDTGAEATGSTSTIGGANLDEEGVERLLEVELGQVAPHEAGSEPGVLATTEKSKTSKSIASGDGGVSADDAVDEKIMPSRVDAGVEPAGGMAWGYVAAALNVAFDTWGTVLTKQHGVELNTWEINFVRFGFAAAALAMGALLKGFVRAMGDTSRGYAIVRRSNGGVETAERQRDLLPRLGRRGWTQIIGGIFCTTFLAPGVSNFALFRVPSLAVFSTLMCIGPIYALPLGHFIKNERVTLRAFVGSVVACLGVIPMFFGDAVGFPT